MTGEILGRYRVGALLAPVVGAQSLRFAPDGRAVYFAAPIGGQLTTYRLSIDGGTPQRVVPLLTRAAVSPDGTKLAGAYRRDERRRWSSASSTRRAPWSRTTASSTSRRAAARSSGRATASPCSTPPPNG